MRDGLCGIESFGTDLDTVHDGVTTEQLIRILQLIEALTGGLIPAIGEKTPRLEQGRGS